MELGLNNITKAYGVEKIFERFSLTFPENEISCVLGASGCGKTTLLNILAGITDSEGNVSGKPDSVSYVFQEPRLLDNLTVYDNLDYVLRQKCTDKQLRDAKIRKFLSLVEMENDAKKYPKELSGGMAQRVSLARAFAYDSGLLLMDEAFQGLDISLKTRLIKLFLRLWKEDKRTVVMVTHDIYEALLLADNVFVISGKPASVAYSTTIVLEKEQRELTSPEITPIRDALIANLL